MHEDPLSVAVGVHSAVALHHAQASMWTCLGVDHPSILPRSAAIPAAVGSVRCTISSGRVVRLYLSFD